MQHYNMLAEVEKNMNLTAWHFRVKILRIHSYYVFGDGPYWSYILADKAGSKIEMAIYPASAYRYKGLEKQEGKWVEIFRVEVDRALPGFKPTCSWFRLSDMVATQIDLINPLNNRHYMEFKRIHQIHHITNKNIPIDIMGVVSNTEVHFEDPTRPKMVFYIRDNIENQIKCVATGDNAYVFRDGFDKMRGRGEVIVVLTMWRICRIMDIDVDEIWLETEGGLSDFRFNRHLPEVEEFRQELLNSDPYVARHGSIVPM